MENTKKKQNLLEKITFYIGVLILTGLIGYLLFEYQKQQNTPPNFEIITSYQPSMPHYTFKVMTTNMGHATASSVNISFDLYQNGVKVENAVLTVDYVPRDSKEEGWVIFRRSRTSSDSLVVASVSYLQP